MSTTRLSSKGQIIIPKAVRDAHQWETGQEFKVMESEEGILLRPTPPFPPTKLEQVAGQLAVTEARTLEEMEAAIRRGAEERKP
jgi:AbrB family looped-hinge helix DNA binding protein